MSVANEFGSITDKGRRLLRGARATSSMIADRIDPPRETRGLISTRYVWYVTGLLTVVNACNQMDRMALAVLAPLIKRDLELSDAQIGLLAGLAFALFYAVCGIPIARWADYGVRRNIIAMAVAVWSLMTVISGGAQNFWQLFAARVGVGAGEAGSYSPGASILCDYIPLNQRSGYFAVHAFGLYAGVMLGMSLAGRLGDIVGWRWTFVVLGVPGVLLALLVGVTLREPVRGQFEPKRTCETRLPMAETLRVLWHCRTYRALVLFLVANGFFQQGLYQWWPSYYVRLLDLDLSVVGVRLGIALGAGSAIGLLVGGFVSNKVANKNVAIPLMIGAAATCVSIPTALGVLFVSSARESMLLVFLTAVAWSVSNGPVLATIYSVSAPGVRATAGAVAIFFTSAIGFSFGPFCVGWLSDILTSAIGKEGLRYALVAPVGALPLMIISLLKASKALPEDLKASNECFDGSSRPCTGREQSAVAE